MHTYEITEQMTDAVVARRGRKHIFDQFDPTRTALVVVDMQNFFCEEEQMGAVAMAREIVPNINAIASALRGAGGVVVWLQSNLDEAVARDWSTFFDYFNRPEAAAGIVAGLTRGTHGYDLWPALDALPGDTYVEKNRFSAFIEGSSDMHAVLQARGIDTLLITGTVTNVCCESTARDASMLNYKTVMVADGNAASSDESHAASLNNLFGGFCDILSTRQVVVRIDAVAGAQAAE
jgi:ureidoacrylate peracid hydrolase